MRGQGVLDVAYFLGWCLVAPDRRAAEADLLTAYHAELLEGGVPDAAYPVERCRADYRTGALVSFRRLVHAAGVLTRSGDRGRRLVDALLARCSAQLADLDAPGLLR